MRRTTWNRIAAGVALTLPIVSVAHADTYLTEAQAAAVLFPGATLTPQVIVLSSQDIKTIQKASDQKVTHPQPRVLKGADGERLFIDDVLGKHEFITYAAAITPDGQVKGIEIMEYHETYGYQVRQADWRAQFVGKDSKAPLVLDKDIRNISGATLSSKHVTDGVRRILQTYELIKDCP
jgi:Na+-translocating ferredoxin:NAD+ oxidoreductase RnfG subunit